MIFWKNTMKNYQNWNTHLENHIFRLTLNRPRSLNSLHSDTLFELKEISEELQKNEEVWVVLLEGEGGNFSSGVDASLLQPLMNVASEEFKNQLKVLQACIDSYEAIRKPKIAKINGYCIGGGLILAACCDFRVASEKAVFSLPEVKIGIAVIMGTQRISRLAGIARTKEMILLAEAFSAAKALEYGLLHQVVADDQLNESVEKLAQKFLFLPPRTVEIANRIIEEGEKMTLSQSQDLEAQLQSELLGSPDWTEAVMSYFQKRKPVFQGK